MGDGCAGYQRVLIEGQSASGDGGLPCGIGGCQDFRRTASSGAGISAGDYKVEYRILICANVDDFCRSTRLAGGYRAYRDGGGGAGGACYALGADGAFRADGTFRADGAFGAGRTGNTVSAVRTGCAAWDNEVKNCILVGAGIVDYNWVLRLSGSYRADGYGGGTSYGAGWASGAGCAGWSGGASGSGCAG